jgi:pimeloyl-ACP methyl ester carboxylesterase
MIKNAKELRRTLDYLETRRDIDHTKIAYLGVSQGGPYGLIFAALADRFRALVLLDGGFFLGNPVAAADPVNFVARVKKPVLMINGRYDPTFPPDLAQKPMFDMLGTPAADKRYVLADAPHDASQQRPLLLKEVLGWLDKYLGRVN